MRRRKEEYKQNNFNGNVNFTGKTQIAAGDIINNISEEKQKTVNYDPEPKWRSPFTLAVLTWISTIIAIVGIFPFAKIVKSIVCFFRGMNGNTISLDMQKYSVIFIIFATVYKGNIIKNLIMDCQSYTKYRPNETTGGIFVSWRRKEELPTGA